MPDSRPAVDSRVEKAAEANYINEYRDRSDVPGAPGCSWSEAVARYDEPSNDAFWIASEVDHYRTEAECILEASGYPKDLEAAEREVERLRETMASALRSLETGPLKDGYAAALLREALAPVPEQEKTHGP